MKIVLIDGHAFYGPAAIAAGPNSFQALRAKRN